MPTIQQNIMARCIIVVSILMNQVDANFLRCWIVVGKDLGSCEDSEQQQQRWKFEMLMLATIFFNF